MRPTREAFVAIVVLVGILTLPPATMAEVYRYEDENGNTVIGNTLPGKVKDRGYEILNEQGRVIEKVPPAPTAEEIAERERLEARERQRRQKEKERRKRDERLLRQYSTPDDAVRALQRKLRERFSTIKLKLGNINSLNNQIAEEQSRAADMERSGREVPDSLHKKMDKLRSEKAGVMAEIEKELEAVGKTRERYRQQIDRLKELVDKERTLPLTVPEEEEARKDLAEIKD